MSGGKVSNKDSRFFIFDTLLTALSMADLAYRKGGIALSQKSLILICALVAWVLPGLAQASEKADVERAVTQMYEQFQDAFTQKDVAQMYRHCDPSYSFIGVKGDTTGLAENRLSMKESLAKVRSLKVTIHPEATELLGDIFMVRYRQEHEISFPLKSTPGRTWFTAEDTWKRKNGVWRLVSTRVVNDSVSDWQQRLAAQREQMKAEGDARASRRCLNGIGYGCGMPR
jgi:hypothetical protein